MSENVPERTETTTETHTETAPLPDRKEEHRVPSEPTTRETTTTETVTESGSSE